MNRAILLITLLVLIKTVASDLPRLECDEVFDSFTPCLGFIEGMFDQPSYECCRGVAHLNNLVNFPPPGSKKKKKEGNGEIERVCECIERLGKGDLSPFLPTAINNLPQLCTLTLSFPVSVSMDCSQFGNNKKFPN